MSDKGFLRGGIHWRLSQIFALHQNKLLLSLKSLAL